jgi:hypothetical protein
MGLFDFLLVMKIVSRAGVVHFRRWRLIETRWFALYVHCIARSDEDKDAHDHPWNFLSLVLRGGYFEDLWRAGKYRHRCNWPGTLVIRKTTDFHKLRLMNGPAWTLVFRGPLTHELWGYKTEEGWVDHIKYRERKNAQR